MESEIKEFYQFSHQQYCPQSMGKMNSDSMRKVWENKTFESQALFFILCMKQRFIQFPKHRKNEFSQYGKSMEKHKHSKIMGLLNISCETKIWEIEANFKNTGKLNSHSTAKLGENTRIPRVWVFYMFHMQQKSIQFPNDGMSEFPYYKTSMGKYR